jgi:hypothetical protein
MPYKSKETARRYWREYRRRKRQEERERNAKEWVAPEEQERMETVTVTDLEVQHVELQGGTPGGDPTIRDAVPHKLDKILAEVDVPPERGKPRPYTGDYPDRDETQEGPVNPYDWMR